MKKLLTTLLFVCCATALFAQYETTSFDVDGIKVIFKPTAKEIINVRVFYRGGVTNYPSTEAGIEGFALDAATQCGTKKYTGNAYKDRADKFDVNIDAEADYDYGDIQMECIAKFFNEGWDLLTEAVVNPVFDNNEVELLRSKSLSKLRSLQSDPDKQVTLLAIRGAFSGTPYVTNPDGDEEVLSKLTAAQLKEYYNNTLLNKNRMYIVVAGKISKEDLVAKIKASFGALPSAPYTQMALATPNWTSDRLVTEERDLATNYISGIFNAPPITSTEFVPYRVGMSAFGGLLFSRLRTKLNLSYDPGAYAAQQRMPYGVMYVSTTNPKVAVGLMSDMLKYIKGITLSEDGLKEIKAAYIVNNYIKQQSSSAITESLGNAEALGDWQMSEKLPDLINDVTTSQISSAISKYIEGVRWGYLGSAQGANEAFGRK